MFFFFFKLELKNNFIKKKPIFCTEYKEMC